MEFLLDYGLFLAKSVTVVVAVIVVIGVITSLRQRREQTSGYIEVINLTDRFDSYQRTLQSAVLDDAALKKWMKQQRKGDKQRRKAAQRRAGGTEEAGARPRLYVLDFEGDIRAEATATLREAISAVLTLATPHDEVLLRLESGGGLVHAYGLAASQLERLRKAGIPLTVAVDKVAASGGYMMACLANRILAAPFAVIGSIGVMAQLPNFHRLLKKHDIDVELHTAGDFKRTLTVFGENTERGREKFLAELEETHQLFKQFVGEHRPQVNLDQVATGEIWYGRQALEKQLVDALSTSDEYLMGLREQRDLFLVRYVEKRSWQEKMGISMESTLDRLLLRWVSRGQRPLP